MAVGKGVIGVSGDSFKLREQNRQRINAGLKKFREAMVDDAKVTASQGSGLPKDWRNRVLK